MAEDIEMQALGSQHSIDNEFESAHIPIRRNTSSSANICLPNLPSQMARRSTVRPSTERRLTLSCSNEVEMSRRGALKRRNLVRQLSRLGAKEIRYPKSTEGDSEDVYNQDVTGYDIDLFESISQTIDFKAIPAPLSFRRECKKSFKHETPEQLSRYKYCKLRFAMGWSVFVAATREWIYSLELWRNHHKEVEGRFGNGVLSYFIVLRWLLILNLAIFVMTFGLIALPASLQVRDGSSAGRNCTFVSQANKSGSGAAEQILDFMTGQGWITNTVMFYGNYPPHDVTLPGGRTYRLPLAYILVGGGYFVLSLIMMLKNLANSFQNAFIESGGAFQSYCNMVFASWDYCISERDTANFKSSHIAQEINVSLAEEERKRRVRCRSKKQKYRLYAMRVFLNLVFIPAVWYLTIVSVIRAVQERTKSEIQDKEKNQFVQYVVRAALSLAITAPNIVLPPLFEFLSIFEDYSPRIELAVNLWRRVFVKLSAIGVLLGVLYDTRNPNCSSCWENEIAAQMYMLVWIDLFVIFVTSVVVDVIRKQFVTRILCLRGLGMSPFEIPENVLDLVYGQCLIWIGAFFSPLLPAMGILKLFVLFYIKKLNLVHNNRMPNKPYQRARANYIFTLLLLFAFMMCLGLVGYGTTLVPPSCCGPFSNPTCDVTKRMFHQINVVKEVTEWQEWLGETVRYLSSIAFIFPVLLFMCMLIYYFRTMSVAHAHVINLLKQQLVSESRFKRVLMNKLAKLELRRSAVHICDESDK